MKVLGPALDRTVHCAACIVTFLLLHCGVARQAYSLGPLLAHPLDADMWEKATILGWSDSIGGWAGKALALRWAVLMVTGFKSLPLHMVP